MSGGGEGEWSHQVTHVVSQQHCSEGELAPGNQRGGLASFVSS